MENILVAGAHGTTGKKIVQLLNTSQYFTPIAMIRKEDQIEHFKSKDIHAIVADLETDVSHAVTGIDKVIFAAGSGGEKVEAVDQEGAKRLIDSAINANVKKFVMLSSLGAENPEEADKLHDYLKAKHNADEYLKQSGLNYCIVRPGALTNDKGNGKIELSKSLDESGEIPREDVAQTLVRALHDDAANNTVFEIVSGTDLISEALEKIS